MFAQDRASQAMGMEILDVAPGRARLAMTVRADMVNGHGICHGGLLFCLADSAFAFACNSFNRKTLAAGARIDFLAPAHLGDRLTASAEQVSRGNRTGVYDVQVHNQDGVHLALFRGNSHSLKDTVLGENSSLTVGPSDTATGKN